MNGPTGHRPVKINRAHGPPAARRVGTPILIGITFILSACQTQLVQSSSAPADCPHPARIEGHLDRSMPNVIVLLRQDADIFTVSVRLASTYAVHFRMLEALHMLVLYGVTKALVERLRCESDIEQLSYDVPTHIG